MSDFDDAWLALREPVDARARDASLERTLAAALRRGARTVSAEVPANDPVDGGPRVLDLGSGTGANLRRLAPLLGRGQRWTLVDRDADLLARVDARLAGWADAEGVRLARRDGGLSLDGAAFDATVRLCRLDLAIGLDALPFAEHGLVTGSALLDLAGAAWLDALAERCARHRCAVLIALSYDGRVRWTPALDDDVLVGERVDRHQRRDKGLGPALGPGAAAHFAAALGTHALAVRTAPSDWRLGAAEAPLQRELAAGYARAVTELEPDLATRVAAWLDARRALIDAGRSELIVGHLDVLALPSEDAGAPA